MDWDCANDKDTGGSPEILNIHNETCCNTNFRTAIWTGEHLQVTVMCIPAGGEVGLERHEDVDQFLKIESGVASVYTGKEKRDVEFLGRANANSAILIPAKTWHNIVNEHWAPLKLYSVYGPPNHPFGTVHKTKLQADLEED